MKNRTIDIRQATLIEFEKFVFDHDVHAIGSDQAWYHNFELVISYDAEHSSHLFTDMFKSAGSLLSKFERSKLEQGCWAMFGSGFDGNLNDLIWENSIPLSTKEALISSMFFVYRDLFAFDPLGEACEMWWDGLAYDIHPMHNVDPVNNNSHKRIQDAMFHTLVKIIELDVRHCQFAALHGLNHVFHPESKNLIKKFVEDNPELSDDEVEYAAACANGLAM